MTTIDATIRDFDFIDRLSAGQSSLHRLDPRAKVVVTLLFIATVASFDRHAVIPLLPFFLLPVVLATLAGVPLRFLLRKVLFLLPVVLLLVLPNLYFDRLTYPLVDGVMVPGGWLSLLSATLKTGLTVSASLVLVAATGMNGISAGLSRLGVPQVLVVQLLMLYRYLFVISDLAARVTLARELRSPSGRGRGLASYAPLVGHLLIRSWERSERIYRAMLGRGFNGTFPLIGGGSLGWRESIFVAGWLLFLLICRFLDLPLLVGTVILGGA
ncbi:MAG TPA: cobalt ECF transporter T component CbiQ [Geobacterales bacterium]|nr:cobalt ECF transporter T component CbiQ [Geobacterales bacterium]